MRHPVHSCGQFGLHSLNYSPKTNYNLQSNSPLLPVEGRAVVWGNLQSGASRGNDGTCVCIQDLSSSPDSATYYQVTQDQSLDYSCICHVNWGFTQHSFNTHVAPSTSQVQYRAVVTVAPPHFPVLCEYQTLRDLQVLVSGGDIYMLFLF